MQTFNIDRLCRAGCYWPHTEGEVRKAFLNAPQSNLVAPEVSPIGEKQTVPDVFSKNIDIFLH